MPVAQDHLEWIIVYDGQTSPDSLARGQTWPAYAKVIKGDGLGATAALNKGIADARGCFLHFLMGDDLLIKEGLAKLIRFLGDDADCDMVTCCVDFFIGEREPYAFHRAKGAPPELDWPRVLYGRPCLGARVFRAEMFRELGLFNTDFSYCSDREYLGRVLIAGFRERCLNEPLYRYRIHAASQTMGGDPNRILRFLQQHLALATIWVKRQRAQQASARRFIDWHAYETARTLYYSLRAHHPVRALGLLIRTLCTTPAWPLRVIRARRVARQLGYADLNLGP